MINLFFFYPIHDGVVKISDLFEVKQGKNISKDLLDDSPIKYENLVLNLNSVNFEYNHIDFNELQGYKDFNEITDEKFVLIDRQDFLVNRTGGYCKTFSTLLSNFETNNKRVVISSNFLYLRPRLAVNVPLDYLHFLLKISIEQLTNKQKGNKTKQQYVTVKEVEDLKIPTYLLNPDNVEEYLKEFQGLNKGLKATLHSLSTTLTLLNKQKHKLELFKQKNFEELIKEANKNK